MFDFRSFQLKSRPWKKNLYGIIIFLVRVFLRFPPTYFPIVCDWGPVFLSASSQWAALQPWRQVFTAGDVRDGGVHLPVPSISVRRNLCTSAWLTLQPLLDSFITRNLSWAIVEQSCFSLRYQLLSFISEKDPRMGTPRGLCFSPLHSKNPGLPPLPTGWAAGQAVLFLPGNPGLLCTWRKPIPPVVCAPVCIQTSL